jgi:hypothetical protein
MEEGPKQMFTLHECRVFNKCPLETLREAILQANDRVLICAGWYFEGLDDILRYVCCIRRPVKILFSDPTGRRDESFATSVSTTTVGHKRKVRVLDYPMGRSFVLVDDVIYLTERRYKDESSHWMVSRFYVPSLSDPQKEFRNMWEESIKQ